MEHEEENPEIRGDTEIPAEEVDNDAESASNTKTTKTPGIIYINSIPEGMQYHDLYKIFSELGPIGRISLQEGGMAFHGLSITINIPHDFTSTFTSSSCTSFFTTTQ